MNNTPLARVIYQKWAPKSVRCQTQRAPKSRSKFPDPPKFSQTLLTGVLDIIK